MKHILIVGIGGFLGAISRYKLGGLVLHHTSSWKFPLSTLLVNVVGCFLIGVISGFFEKQLYASAELKLFLIAGLLGGFTTFSAFGFETIFLIKRGYFLFAALNVLLSVGCGLFAVWLGFVLGEFCKA